jgi:AcrR family transcriptional regulator
MSMPSTLANAQRRSPQQLRAARRRATFLDAAGQLIGRDGFEAVTMTAIAERAGASIGALYDYFPDKQALAFALLTEYVAEADAYWAALLNEARLETEREFAEVFIEGLLAFVREHPAYLPLIGAPIVHARTAEARKPLRRTVAGALRKVNSRLSDERAFLSAQVTVELVKGMLAVYKQVAAKDRSTVVAEFKELVVAYLTGGHAR